MRFWRASWNRRRAEFARDAVGVFSDYLPLFQDYLSQRGYKPPFPNETPTARLKLMPFSSNSPCRPRPTAWLKPRPLHRPVRHVDARLYRNYDNLSRWNPRLAGHYQNGTSEDCKRAGAADRQVVLEDVPEGMHAVDHADFLAFL